MKVVLLLIGLFLCSCENSKARLVDRKWAIEKELRKSRFERDSLTRSSIDTASLKWKLTSSFNADHQLWNELDSIEKELEKY